MDDRNDPREFDELVRDLETFADKVGTAPLGEVMAELPIALEKHQRAMAMLDRFRSEIEQFQAATCDLDATPSPPAEPDVGRPDS